MTNLLKTITLTGFSCFILGLAAVRAQHTPKNKLGEFDEIVIKRKSDKDSKVTIEIKDGDIMIDGKKSDQFSNPDISVFRRRITPVDGNNFSFENDDPRGSIDLFNGDEDTPLLTPNKAVLGVITEKITAKGTTVKTVAKDSPAEKAGIRAGDVITKVDSNTITEPKALFEAIGTHQPGDKVTVTYLRAGKESRVTVTLDERKDAPTGIIPIPRNRGDIFSFPPLPRDRQGFGNSWLNTGDDTRLGLQVQDTESGEGAQVLDITPASPAGKAGFKVNDIILELAGTPVNSAREVAAAYRANRNKGTIAAAIKREGKTQTLEIKVPKKLNKADL